MKTLLIVLLLLFACLSLLNADITTFYTFAQENQIYSPVTGTTLPDLQTDDAIDTVNIGFAFPYGTNSFSQIIVSTNGWIGLGNSLGFFYPVNQLNSTSTCPILAPLWDDLSLNNGTIQYLQSGIAPNRKLTVQYSGVHWNYQAVNSYQFQVKLYESGRIEFCYGSGAGVAIAPSASIGINMAPGGTGNFYSLSSANPASVSTTSETWQIMSFPAAGTVYAFQPVAPVAADLAALSISGNSMLEQNTPAEFIISVRNLGTTAQNSYSVKLMSGTTELASVNGSYIAPLQQLSFPISWVPNATGIAHIYGKVVLPADEHAYNDQTAVHTSFVYTAGNDVSTIGEGNELARIPLDLWWRYSLFETLYYPAEINNIGYINGITLYKEPGNDFGPVPVSIWMGETTSADLAQGWIPASQLTLVYTGSVSYYADQNILFIPFTTPYYYTGGNLAMLAYHYHNFYSVSSTRMQSQTIGNNRARIFYSDATEPNPLSPPAPTAAQLSGQFPRTSLIINPVSNGQLSGLILDTNNQPVSGALVSVVGISQSCISSATGAYSFSHVPAGNREVTASCTGYASQTQHFTVVAGQNNTLNFSLQGTPFVSVTGRVVQADNPTAGIAGAEVCLDGNTFYTVSTNAAGYFTFPQVESNLLYVYSADHAGFVVNTGTVQIGYLDVNMGNILLNIGAVAVNGRVVHAAYPYIGISNALVTLTGDAIYNVATDGDGYFVYNQIPVGHIYTYSISKVGYETLTGSIDVQYANYNMQNLPITELLLPPIDVGAVVILDEPFPVTISWNAPSQRQILNIDAHSASHRDESRSPIGYQVYQLQQGQENEAALWELLTPEPITGTWITTPHPSTPFGQVNFLWAVKAIYTNFQYSPAGFSNFIPAGSPAGRIQGTVRNAESQTVLRNVTLVFNPGNFTVTTDVVGHYQLILGQNTYSNSIDFTGYEPFDSTGIVVQNLDDLTMDINLIPFTSNPENPVTPSLTRVIGCYPNPFNSQTVIRYAISKQDLLTLDIYNLKGQKIRSLLHQTQTPGEHDIVWNGYTDYGIRAACGIYLYKLQTGATTLTGKLMLSE